MTIDAVLIIVVEGLSQSLQSKQYCLRMKECWSQNSPSLTPQWRELILVVRSFIRIANNVGSQLPPCRTRGSMENQSVKSLFSRTQLCILEYMLCIVRIIFRICQFKFMPYVEMADGIKRFSEVYEAQVCF